MTEAIELPIKRFEAFEQKLGIKLEGLFASFDSEDKEIHVNGDVFAIDGTTTGQDIKLVISCHDSLGRVIGSDYSLIEAEFFSGIDTFLGYLYAPISVEKVHVYPKIS